jgi:hypothetical protein
MIESKYGLIFPGAELLLNSYCLPPQDGGTDSSGKRRLPKEATTSYVSGEPNAAVRMLNPSAHTELTAVSEKIHINDFPVTIERMRTFMDTLFKAVMGSSCLDGKGGGPVMSPLSADEKEMHVTAFRLWVDTTTEVYLKPTRGGKDTENFQIVRRARLHCFIISRVCRAWIMLNTRFLGLGLEMSWAAVKQASDEAASNPEKGGNGGTELLTALRILGYACPTCRVLGGTDLFCGNGRCTVNSPAAGSKGAAATATAITPAARSRGTAWPCSGPDKYWNRQSEFAALQPQPNRYLASMGVESWALGGM